MITARNPRHHVPTVGQTWTGLKAENPLPIEITAVTATTVTAQPMMFHIPVCDPQVFTIEHFTSACPIFRLERVAVTL